MLLRKISMSLLTVIFPLSTCLVAFSQSGSNKAEVERRIREHKENVHVEMIDGSTVHGRISKAGDTTFTVIEKKPLPHDRSCIRKYRELMERAGAREKKSELSVVLPERLQELCF